MTVSDCVRIPDEVLARQVGEETVILHLASGTYFSLDPVGARVWQLLAQGATLAEVCAAIVEEYDVSEEQLARDVMDLVEDLAGHGLVVVV